MELQLREPHLAVRWGKVHFAASFGLGGLHRRSSQDEDPPGLVNNAPQAIRLGGFCYSPDERLQECMFFTSMTPDPPGIQKRIS